MLKNSTDPELIRAADLSTNPMAKELANRLDTRNKSIKRIKQLIKHLEAASNGQE